MNLTKEQLKTGRWSTCNSDFEVRVHYPDRNPDGIMETITKTLTYTGVFDGLKEKVSS